MCSKPKTGYHAETVRNLCRVTDIIFSKCSNIGVLKLTQPFDRQNLPLAAFPAYFGIKKQAAPRGKPAKINDVLDILFIN